MDLLRRARRADLAKLNSLTKYPSILTYHTLGQKGVLTEEVNITFAGDVVLTEKVDGTNARVIMTPRGEWLIGSREELLTAHGDIIFNPAQRIVETLEEIASEMMWRWTPTDAMITFYFEVFGGGVGSNAKQYTTSKNTSYRLFDVGITRDVDEKITWDREKIASWREHGGQEFADEQRIADFCERFALPRVPVINIAQGADLPLGTAGTHSFLKYHIDETKVALDNTARKRPEGLVLRTADRKQIAKVRFEDYERTARARGKK